MKKSSLFINLLLPVISVALIFAVWGISAAIVGDAFLIPDIGATVSEFFSLLGSGEFYKSLLLTVARSLISFVASFIIALILAVTSKRHEKAKRFFAPIIAVMRALPTVAVVLLLLVWTNSFIAPIVVTSLVVLPTVYTNVYGNLNLVDGKQIEMCKLFNVSGKDTVKKVLIPQIAPSLLSTVGSAISLTLKLTVAAEVLSATGNSLGNMLNIAANVTFETAKMLALVISVVIIGLITEWIFGLLSKKSGAYL